MHEIMAQGAISFAEKPPGTYFQNIVLEVIPYQDRPPDWAGARISLTLLAS